ncbi:MAG: GNAT family N-acetyltransferase [Bacteroidales bacterium]|nr:GNAT family N-acetyltransferase [Bacteroidales bacterium]
MIKYLKHHQIDQKKWDNCIRQAVNGNIYACSWYLDLVHDGWEALVENDYERVMPLTGGRKFGVSYLFQPYFTQQLGVFSSSKLNPEIVRGFVQSIPSHFKFAEINLNSFNKISEGVLFVPLKNYVLDLINPYEKILKKYSANTRRNLKKGQASQLYLTKNIKPEELIQLFRANRGRNLKWDDAHYTTLRRIMYTAIHKGKGALYGVYTGFNELCAAAFFLKNNNRLVFLFSGTDETARKNGGMTLLIDGVIREYAASKTIFDFEGSNDEQLARFYRGFGAKEITYPGLRINRLCFPLKQSFRFYKQFKK